MTGVTLKIVFTLPTHKQEIRRFTTTEREVLAEELRREMAASILRRVDGVVRSSPVNAAP